MAVFNGDSLNNSFTGTVGDDNFTGLGGNDTFDGAAGVDMAHFSAPLANYVVYRVNATTTWVGDMTGAEGVDVLQNTEFMAFADQTVNSTFQNFNPLKYIASHGDLIAAFGTDAAAGFAHYVNQGHAEGRTESFDALAYIASYPDLMTAFGTDQEAATTHYIHHGYNEGRTASFDALAYIASYPDLMTAFGADQEAAATHYIHHGYNEGRTATFDALAYLAAYEDLSAAFGTDQAAATLHYINHGYSEGRTAAVTNQVLFGTAGDDTLTGFGGNDILLGIEGNDLMSGGSGNDLLDGGTGNDTMSGGLGDDSFIVDSSGDIVSDSGGVDSIEFSVAGGSYTLAEGIEIIRLVGTALNVMGNNSANLITGNASANILTGLGGNDTLDGGGGADILTGGTGDDLYVLSGTAVINELAGEGFDTVQTNVAFTLGANLENLILTGGINGVGNSAANAITGNNQDNIISGLGGDDILYGMGGFDELLGGEGNDTLNGGASDDILAGGNGVDVYVFTGAFGDDEIETHVGNNLDIADFSSFHSSQALLGFSNSGDSLSIAITIPGGGLNEATISNWNLGIPGLQLDTFRFSDGTFTSAQLTWEVVVD